jgi:hypothetical protein
MRCQHRIPVATWAVAITVCIAAIAGLHAQQAPLTSTALTPVPRLMWFNGTFRPADNLPVAPVENITVAVYRERDGGDALWRETQNVAMDADGRYSLLIGSTVSDGMPLELFTSGEPCWIGITVNRPGESEQPRVHQASVPYALKAADAETLGGLPASAYLRAPAAEPDGVAVDREASSAAMPTDPDVTSAVVQPGTTNFLAKYVNGADVGNSAVYEAGGAVGIGTTTPFDLMHLRFTNTGGTATGLAVQNLGNSATSYSGMLFYDQTGALAQFQGFNNGTHEYRINNIALGGRINFMIGNSSKFVVANNGNIGVGTDFPNHKLHVLDASNAGLRVQTNTVGGTVASFGGFGEFQIDAPGVAGGRFIVKENSRVGIRSATPAATLEIQSGADFDGSNDLTAIAFGYRLGGYRHWIRTRHNPDLGDGTGNAIDFFVNNSVFDDGSTAPGDGSIHVMTLDSGKVGIGTISPDRTLSVNGGASKVGGGSWDTFSDERLKHIKGPFTPGLSALMQLQPVRYEYKTDNALGLASSGEHIGFSAQAVKQIISEAVSTSDRGYLLLNNDPIVWTMLNAIKEQQKEIQEQEHEIRDLQRRLAALEAARDRRILPTAGK